MSCLRLAALCLGTCLLALTARAQPLEMSTPAAYPPGYAPTYRPSYTPPAATGRPEAPPASYTAAPPAEYLPVQPVGYAPVQPAAYPPNYPPNYAPAAVEQLPHLNFGPPPLPQTLTTPAGPTPGPPSVAPGSRGPGAPPVGPPPATVPPVGAPTETIVVEEVFAEPAPPVVLPKLWEGSVELGVNGTEGNSENFNFRFLVNAKRTTAANVVSLNSRYINNSANSVQTADRLFGEGRYEWLFKSSPWSIYVHSTGEYDEFRAFDVRLTGDAGLGYQFIKNDFISLLGRAGPGFSQEIGGPDDSIVPEAVFGLAYEQKLTAKSKLTATTDYYPDISEFGEFRLNNQVNWEVCLDELLNLSLKFSILDRYDSTPNGAKANDLDYSATILWSF